jgi:hypothetical protein
MGVNCLRVICLRFHSGKVGRQPGRKVPGVTLRLDRKSLIT